MGGALLSDWVQSITKMFIKNLEESEPFVSVTLFKLPRLVKSAAYCSAFILLAS